MRKSIPKLILKLERSGDLFVVSDNVYCVYGQGDTVTAAMSDYGDSLLEFYEILKAHKTQNITQAESLSKLLDVV